jgi:hypothetical protein
MPVHINLWIVLVPLGRFLAYAYTAGGLKTKCPACRKHIKLGATACHHGMRSIVRA